MRSPSRFVVLLVFGLCVGVAPTFAKPTEPQSVDLRPAFARWELSPRLACRTNRPKSARARKYAPIAVGLVDHGSQFGTRILGGKAKRRHQRVGPATDRHDDRSVAIGRLSADLPHSLLCGGNRGQWTVGSFGIGRRQSVAT